MSPSDFTIDGNNATGVTVVDNHTLSFSFNTTSDGIHNVSISGLEDLQGTALTPDNFTFETDDVPPVRRLQLDRRWGRASRRGPTVPRS